MPNVAANDASDHRETPSPCSSEARPVSSARVSSNLLRSARLIGLLTLASRILGLARDVAISIAFGAGTVSSAFWTAFQIPNLFRRLFGEGALSAASIPVLTETLSRDGRETADRLAGRLMSLLIAMLCLLCVLGELVIAGLYWLYRSDSDSELVLALSAIMLPYLIFICTAALLGGVQNVFDRFASAAAAPIILNLFMIVSALATHRLTDNLRLGIVILSTAVVISGAFQVAWQWAASRRIGLRLPLSLDTRDPALRRIGSTMLPTIAGMATIQINTLVGSLLAWWFVPEVFSAGSGASERVGPAILGYAQRLYQFPLGVFTTALATAIFPLLSRFASERDLPGLSHMLSRGIRVASFEGLPCLVGLIVVREPLIRTLFAHGQFNQIPHAVDRVGLSLIMYSLGIWAFGVNQIVVRAFYAMQDARTPMRISVRNVALNLVLNLILVHTALREAGLALATTLAAMVQIVILVWTFDRRYARLEWRHTAMGVLRALLASLIMGMAVVALDRCLPAMAQAMRLGLLVATGAAVYLAAAFALRCEELREMTRR